MTKTSVKTLDAMTTDTMGTTCAACRKEYKIWFIGTRVIGRIYCRCEAPTGPVNKFGLPR